MNRRISLSSLRWPAMPLMFSLLVVAASGQSPHGAPAAVAGPGKTAAQQFKNIQVLKDVPAEQFIPAMQFISASLGVECQFCHVPDAFEKDDKKPKQAARTMMQMMLAIDRENFDGHLAVTCYSCHRGNIRPVATPAVMAELAQPARGAESKLPAPALIEKYVKAVGGVSAIDRVSTRVMKGTITFGDSKVPIDIFAKAPDMRVSFTHTPDGDSVTAFDGHAGWLGFPGRPARDMHGPDIDGASIDADLHFPASLKTMFSKAEVRGTEVIGDREAFLLVGDRPGKSPLHLYFDTQTGLLLRLVRFADTPLGELPTQIDYADYRDAGGVKIPFRWTLARTSGRFTIQVSEVKVNVPVEDSKFAKPAAAEEQKSLTN